MRQRQEFARPGKLGHGERVLGLHWVADAIGCDPLRLSRVGVQEALIDLPHKLGLVAVGAPSLSEHRIDGTPTVAGVVLLAESHASCHAFPDDGAAHFDVFSCKPFDVEAARRYLLRHFGAAELRDSVLKRGPGESRHHSPLVLVRGVR